MDKLNSVRQKIDAIDSEIVELLQTRLDLSKQVYEAKKKRSLKIIDVIREQQVFKNLESLNYSAQLKKIYKEIMKQSKIIQKSQERGTMI